MNIKWSFVIVLVILFCACKRELSTHSYQAASSPLASAAFSESFPGLSATRVEENNTDESLKQQEPTTEYRRPFLEKEKKFVAKKIAEKNIFSKQTRKELKEKKEIKKETDPRLSRGLWMTIFGGIATTLGIVFMGYAPTGLFVFAFGIVFIVGVVTLIMYLSNPKPKM